MNPFIGQISMFAGNFAPQDWAFCDGQLIAISQNTALFSILGTSYGGDGRTTFALPDLRGRTPIHQGHAPGLSSYRLGQRGGVESVELTVSEIPQHTHLAQAGTITNTTANSSDVAVNEVPAVGDVPAVANFPGSLTATKVKSFGPANNLVNGRTSSESGGVPTILPTGGSQSHENMQPYTVVNYIIALQGIYPSRS